MFVAALISIALGGIRADGFTGKVTLKSGKVARQAVVFLDSDLKPEPMKRVVIDQRDRKFIPHVSVVTVGTRVAFPNNDVIFHNVFTEYHSERFDFGLYRRGDTKYWTFDRAGLAVLLCSIHPDMSAYVMCVDTPYFAVADGKGNFSIPNVPRGTYTVHAWHESGETYTGKVVVGTADPVVLRTGKE